MTRRVDPLKGGDDGGDRQGGRSPWGRRSKASGAAQTLGDIQSLDIVQEDTVTRRWDRLPMTGATQTATTRRNLHQKSQFKDISWQISRT